MNPRLATTPQQYEFLKGVIDQALAKPPRDDEEVALMALARSTQVLIEGCHTVAYQGRTAPIQRAAKERLKSMAHDILAYRTDALARMVGNEAAKQMHSRWWPVIDRWQRFKVWLRKANEPVTDGLR